MELSTLLTAIPAFIRDMWFALFQGIGKAVARGLAFRLIETSNLERSAVTANQPLHERWHGELFQGFGPRDTQIQAICSMSLRATRRRKGRRQEFEGTLSAIFPEATHGEHREEIFSLTGCEQAPRIYKIEYVSVRANVRQVGTALLELSNTSDSLIGHFIGFGPRSDRIINGPIAFRVTR